MKSNVETEANVMEEYNWEYRLVRYEQGYYELVKRYYRDDGSTVHVDGTKAYFSNNTNELGFFLKEVKIAFASEPLSAKRK
jgi:hypothetical protein